MLNIALFGTSADPPTVGHKAILRWLFHHYGYVAVWAADNPFKDHQTSLEHRSTMLQLLIDEIRWEQSDLVSLASIEPQAWHAEKRIGLHPELSHSRTVITVQRAREQWPSATLTLVVGADLVPQLPKWYRAEELLRQVQILIMPRPGYPLKEADLETLRQKGTVVTIAEIDPPEISSTAYREQGNLGVLTTPIEAYIHQQHLYKCA